MNERYCVAHQCEFVSFMGFYKCPKCNWEQASQPLIDEKYASLNNRINGFHEHKIRQIDENRKISRRVDELEKSHIQEKQYSNEMIKRLEKSRDANSRSNKDIFDRIEKLESQVSSINKQKFSEFHHLKPDIDKLENKINMLEDSYKADYETAKELIFNGAQTHASILKCEKGLKDLDEKVEQYHISEFKNNQNWMWELEKRIKKIEEQIIEMRGLSLHPTKPHRCPVCLGEGINRSKLVMDGVVEPSTISLKNPACHSCEGRGIIWG